MHHTLWFFLMEGSQFLTWTIRAVSSNEQQTEIRPVHREWQIHNVHVLHGTFIWQWNHHLQRFSGNDRNNILKAWILDIFWTVVFPTVDIGSINPISRRPKVGDVGKNPSTPYGSFWTHRSYSLLYLWLIFSITKLHFY